MDKRRPVAAPQPQGLKFLNDVRADPQRFFNEYEKRFGNVLNADNAATLFYDYVADPVKYREAVHQAATEIRDRLFARKLAEEAPVGKNFVLFTAGGNASGKSTITQLAGSSEAAHVVYDSTLANLDRARQLVQQALASHKPVAIQHVSRPIDEAFRGMLERSRSEGRVVSIRQMLKSQRASANTVQVLQREFAGNPRVKFRFYDNRGGAARETSRSSVLKSYAESRHQLNEILDSEYRAGRVSEDAYQKIRGPEDGRVDPGDGSVSGPVQSEDSGWAE